MRRRAAERARKDLEKGGQEEEGLAERAKELGEQARDKGSLPQQAVETLDDAERAARQAAEALQQGDADKGIERQREAQRALEQARQQLEGDEQDSSSPSKDDGDNSTPSNGERRDPRRQGAQGPRGVPPARRARPRPAGERHVKEAVRRYAEGLLR